MKDLERKKTITYRWWRDDKQDIKDEHIAALEESANERIQKMMADGYTSGILSDQIRMSDDDGEEGIKYSGWFEITIPE